MVRKRVGRKGRAAAPPSASPSKRGLPSDNHSRRRPGVGNDPALRRAALVEAAGATAAGCAALCCCCPCGLLNLLFAVALKLPAALLRRALTRRRRQRRKRWSRADGWKAKGGAFCDGDGDDDLSRRDWGVSSQGTTWPAISQSPETAELEKEMLSKFRSGGFWRSPSRSQRE